MVRLAPHDCRRGAGRISRSSEGLGGVGVRLTARKMLPVLLIADVLTTWTKWLAFATFAAVLVALIGLGWSIRDASQEREMAEDRLADQRRADDARANQQIAAAREDAERQVAAAQKRLESQRAADDARADPQIDAARDAAQRQVAEMQHAPCGPPAPADRSRG